MPLLKRERGAGNEHSEQENEKWEQSRELKRQSLIGLGFKLGFVSIFHFPVPRARSPLPGPRVSNIPMKMPLNSVTRSN